MATVTKVVLKMDLDMDMEYLLGLMEIFMRENIKMGRYMEREKEPGEMEKTKEIFMMGNGLKI